MFGQGIIEFISFINGIHNYFKKTYENSWKKLSLIL